MRSRAGWKCAAAFIITAVVAACATTQAPGQFGTFRFAGKAKGGAPLPLMPPVTDRAGNVYILYGAVEIPQNVEVFVGRAGGGWTSGCKLTKGDDFGAHGWVGYDEEHQWYWSGLGLFSVSGKSADCHAVLDQDVGTDVNLFFKGVIPLVRDAPTRTTMVAIVQSSIDPAPFTARVDLQAEILTDVQAFTPTNAIDVAVAGVGADRGTNQGFAVFSYHTGEETHVEARFYDMEAQETARAPIPSDPLAPYSILGYLERGKSGIVAGLVNDGRLITFDEGGGRVTKVESLKPIGVHRWQDDLWVVGTNDDGIAMIAPIGADGSLGPPGRWKASEDAAGALAGPHAIRDDRSLPSRATTWTHVETAIGPKPFLSSRSVIQHADDTTLWLVAGPTFDTAGTKITAFAVAPVGITYP